MTIRESRRIVFDEAELLNALRQNGSLAPQLGSQANSKPVSVAFSPAEDCILIQYEAEQQVQMGGAKLAALIMRQCIVNHTPLPKNANKSLLILTDSVVLVIELPTVGTAVIS